MRNLIPILLAVVVLSSGCDPEVFEVCGDFVEHDGYAYSTVQIGDQCWFSENCRYLPVVSPSSDFSHTYPDYYVYEYEGLDETVAKSTYHYETYGVLYNWPAVMTEGICPSGWHIPSDLEWQTMEMSLGMHESAAANEGYRGSPVGDYMKSTSGWNKDGNGTNNSGFNGLPGGRLDNPWGFANDGQHGRWWTSSATGPLGSSSGIHAWQRSLFNSNDYVGRNEFATDVGFSARCVRD